MKVRCLVALFFLAVATASAQKQEMPKMLLMDMDMMVQATRAVNDMYNFKFDKAETEFRWFQIKYPNHPLPYFLLGLSEWWKIVPNIDNQQYDGKFLAYMDTVINLSEQLYEANEKTLRRRFSWRRPTVSRGGCIRSAKTGARRPWPPSNPSTTSTRAKATKN
jgi:hypothetical protein